MRELMRLDFLWDVGVKENVNKNKNWILKYEKMEVKVMEKEFF